MLSELERVEYDEIDGFMRDNDNDEDEEKSFEVHDLSSANWCLRKISVLDKQEAEMIELAEAEMLRIKGWLESKKKNIAYSKSKFENLLTTYLLKKRQDDKKFRVDTPYGSVGTRKPSIKWHYDDDKLVNWLKGSELNDYIRVKEEANKAGIKKDFNVVGGRVVSSDGEIVEGIIIEELGEKVVIKTKGD